MKSSDILHQGEATPTFSQVAEDQIFNAIRGALNLDYHKRYSLFREQWQNAVARLIVGTSDGTTHPPWVVFAAGPGGVGKGYVMRYLTEMGILALPNLVYVDVDSSRAVIPEWPAYRLLNKKDPGAMTQREAGLIAELAHQYALHKNRNVVIDGTMSNKGWNVELVNSIRAHHPHYKIAVIYVTAPLEVVLARARDRAVSTGRVVPEDLIRKAVSSCAETVAALAEAVDLTATIAAKLNLLRFFKKQIYTLLE